MAEAKNVLNVGDLKVIDKALGIFRAQVLRAKVKEASDVEMVAMYDRRLQEIDFLRAKMLSKDLF